jgi:hypothetical protein
MKCRQRKWFVGHAPRRAILGDTHRDTAGPDRRGLVLGQGIEQRASL